MIQASDTLRPSNRVGVGADPEWRVWLLQRFEGAIGTVELEIEPIMSPSLPSIGAERPQDFLETASALRHWRAVFLDSTSRYPIPVPKMKFRRS